LRTRGMTREPICKIDIVRYPLENSGSAQSAQFAYRVPIVLGAAEDIPVDLRVPSALGAAGLVFGSHLLVATVPEDILGGLQGATYDAVQLHPAAGLHKALPIAD